jgi:DNA-binding protein H-NS
MSDTETDAQRADAQPSARESKRRPAIDLDRMTVAELTMLRDAAEAKRREKLDDAKHAVLEETREKLAQLGLTLEAVLPSPVSAGQGGQGRKKRRDAGQPLPVKYRGPNGQGYRI